jgi:hypothetical protein
LRESALFSKVTFCRRGGKRWRLMGNDPALAIVRWQSKRNQGLSPLVAACERANILCERADVPTMGGASMITFGAQAHGER